MQFDLIIVGGGLVGAGLACALGEMQQRIAVIDAREPMQNDPRLFALNALSCQFLKNLNIWSALLPAAAAINQVHVSSKGQFGAVRLKASDVELPHLGYVVPAFLIERALQHKLKKQKNITLIQPAQLKHLTQKDEDDDAVLTIQSPGGDCQIRAPLIVGADGAGSTVRQQLNIETEMFDYEQQALVTQTILERDHRHIAFERFIKDGAIAMLPLTQSQSGHNRCATIWSGPNNVITALNALSEKDFLQALQDQFGYRLGRLHSTSQRFIYPLQMVRAKETIVGKTILLGNAAHTLHPIAAQGFNLALYEVACLVETLEILNQKNEKWTAEQLETTIQNLAAQQKVSIQIAHRLPQLFSSKSNLLSVLRPLAMTGLNLATPLKKHFINRLMSKAGRVPDLLLSVSE